MRNSDENYAAGCRAQVIQALRKKCVSNDLYLANEEYFYRKNRN